MDFSAIVGVAVGLAFTYLLLSLVCSTMQEWIAALLRRRASNLRTGLLAMLRDPNSIERFYSHPLIASLAPMSSKKVDRAVAYIPSSNFASALLDNVAPRLLAPGADILKEIDGLPIKGTPLGKALRALAEQAAGDRDAFFAAVEKWFNDSMDRVSGWYKRETQVIILALSVVSVIAFNVDSIRIASELYHNAGVREAINAAANQYITTHERPATPNRSDEQKPVLPPNGTPAPTSVSGTVTSSTHGTDSTNVSHAGSTTAPANGGATERALPVTDYRSKLQGNVDDLMSLDLPIGWEKGVTPWSFVGWLITIAAVSLGAPFWFDTLVRVSNIRNNGPKPTKVK